MIDRKFIGLLSFFTTIYFMLPAHLLCINLPTMKSWIQCDKRYTTSCHTKSYSFNADGNGDDFYNHFSYGIPFRKPCIGVASLPYVCECDRLNRLYDEKPYHTYHSDVAFRPYGLTYVWSMHSAEWKRSHIVRSDKASRLYVCACGLWGHLSAWTILNRSYIWMLFHPNELTCVASE